MTHLSGRTGVQIKAVLSVLHKAGHNVGAIERQAENAMRTGRPAVAAYESAVGQHLKSAPGIKPTVERVARLIAHSDDASIARYERALDAYIGGNEGPIDALAPMVRADMQAIAVRDGELSADDAAAGRVDWAGMGIPGFVEQGSASLPPSGPQQAARTAEPPRWSNQVGASASPRAADFNARAERVSYGDAAPLASGSAARTAASHPASGTIGETI